MTERHEPYTVDELPVLPDMEAITARLALATKGPWEADQAQPWTPRQKNAFGDYGASIVSVTGEEVVVGGSDDEQGGAIGVLTNEDAQFIANAWDDITNLLAYIHQLRIALFEEQRARWQAEQDAQRWREEAEALRVQVEQLAEALDVATGVSST